MTHKLTFKRAQYRYSELSLRLPEEIKYVHYFRLEDGVKCLDFDILGKTEDELDQAVLDYIQDRIEDREPMVPAVLGEWKAATEGTELVSVRAIHRPRVVTHLMIVVLAKPRAGDGV